MYLLGEIDERGVQVVTDMTIKSVEEGDEIHSLEFGPTAHVFVESNKGKGKITAAYLWSGGVVVTEIAGLDSPAERGSKALYKLLRRLERADKQAGA